MQPNKPRIDWRHPSWIWVIFLCCCLIVALVGEHWWAAGVLFLPLGVFALSAYSASRRGAPNKLQSTWREWVNRDEWAPFRAGYLAALEDNLHPITEKTRKESVERAFKRTYGIEG